MMTVVEPEALKLGPLAREAIEMSEVSDLSVVAEQTFGTVPEVMREQLALWGWRETLRGVIRGQRRRRPVSTRSAGVEASRAAREAGVLERFYFVGGAFKVLGECSVENVYRIAEDYQERADENAREAGAFTQLLKVMKRAKVATVADLGEEKVERIFNA